MKVIIRPITLRGNPAWKVDARIDGKRFRRFFKSQAEAKREAAELREKSALVSDAWLGLTPLERAQLLNVAAKVKEAGANLDRVWTDWQQTGNNGQQVPSKSLKDVCLELLAAKTAANRRKAYLEHLALILRQFRQGWEHAPIAGITTKDVELWLSGRKEAPSTRLTTLSRLSTLFSWAQRKGYCKGNPVEGIDKPTVDHKVPAILRADQAEALIRFVHQEMPDALAYFALGLFCGLRPEEIKRLPKGRIDLQRGLIWLDAETTKTRHKRIFHMSANAVAWLKEADLSKCVTPSKTTLRRRLRKLIRTLGIDWKADLLRHTAASMLLAREENVAKVARELGNSPSILLKHYQELVTKDEAERFWRIAP